MHTATFKFITLFNAHDYKIWANRASNLQYPKSVTKVSAFQYFSRILAYYAPKPKLQYFSVFLQYFASKISTGTGESVRLEALESSG